MKFRDVMKRPLARTIALTTVTAVSGSLATDPKSAWYASLDLPAWQPAGWAFPVVWTALYSDIAVTSAKVITELDAESDPEYADAYRRALLVNLALNQAWSWTFFKAHRLAASTLVATLLAGSSIDLARRAGRAGGGMAAALAPYAAWCTFATVLTAAIQRRNS